MTKAESDKAPRRLAGQLFSTDSERESFVSALQAGQSGRRCAFRPGSRETSEQRPVWAPNFVRFAAADEPEAYLLDSSSVFAFAPVLSVDDTCETVLDLCASPGGKSLLAWTCFEPKLLICNEVIGKRIAKLHGNLSRFCVQPALICQSDPSVFAQQEPRCADLVLVDAPCSGQSLLARGRRSARCFHPATILTNAKRQRRILANAAQCVAPGGYLLYSTCTFSLRENERVIEWFLKRFAEFLPLEVSSLADFRSKHSDAFCYRLHPQQGLGAGAFTCLLRRDMQSERRMFGKNIPILHEF